MMHKGWNMQPMLLKSGAALAITLGGILYNYLIRNKNKAKKKQNKSLPPPSQDSLDIGEQADSGEAGNDSYVSCSSCSSVGPEKHEDLPLSRSPTRSFRIDNCSPRASANGEKDELHNLRNTVRNLKEKEKELQSRLLMLYGHKEQETTVMELLNRLEIKNMESEIFKVKIESLEADKNRLREQVGDHVKVSTALEDANAKIKLLKRTMKYEGEQNKKQILSLQQKVKNLQEHEKEDVAANQAAIEEKVQYINDLKKEAEELKKSNKALRLQNSDLSQKLDYVNLIATTVLDDDERSSAVQRLKKEKDELLNKIEQLHADHSADAEELVYLRWLNACYRHQLRRHNPMSTSPREQINRELSRTFSSELDDKSNSCVTDSGEDSSTIDLGHHSRGHTRTKVINKVMKLLSCKKRNKGASGDTSAYIVDMMGTFPSYSPGSNSGFETVVTDSGPDGTYDSSCRSSSQGSRLSS